MTMTVASIEWIDESICEAILVVSDGNFECTVFCHPCDLNVGTPVTETLKVLEAESLRASDGQLGVFAVQNGGFECRIVGLSGNDRRIVTVGELRFELPENLPSDICEEKPVEFFASRIDL